MASTLLGLDIVEAEAAKLRDLGYDSSAGCNDDSLGRTCDVIIAGEIIEHISNPGAFVANMARHLNDGGRLVLTTPYAHYARYFAESLLWQPDPALESRTCCLVLPVHFAKPGGASGSYRGSLLSFYSQS